MTLSLSPAGQIIAGLSFKEPRMTRLDDLVVISRMSASLDSADMETLLRMREHSEQSPASNDTARLYRAAIAAQMLRRSALARSNRKAA